MMSPYTRDLLTDVLFFGVNFIFVYFSVLTTAVETLSISLRDFVCQPEF